MPLRCFDPLLDRAVLISAERAQRPGGLSDEPSLRTQFAAQPTFDRRCPFCPGNESQTPPATRLLADPHDPESWQARIIGNKYPAVSATATVGARGIHEVLIPTPRHLICYSQLTSAESQAAWQLLSTHLRDMRTRRAARWCSVFQNVGRTAGASQAHLHWQLLALDEIPTLPRTEDLAGAQYLAAHGCCHWCAEIVAAEAAGRLIARTPKFAILSPAAPRLPYETLVLPITHGSHVEFADQDELADLGLQLIRLFKVFSALVPAYNWWIHSGPFDSEPTNHYHWHIEILPRLTTTAGFEWSSGWYINPVSPAAAASVLRTAWEQID